MRKTDAYFMEQALKEARKAALEDEVPVGAVIVKNGKIIARAHNKRQNTHDVFGHAECIAIKKATKKLQTWILEDTTLYVTLEPCLMCAGAILQARIQTLVYATEEPKFGCVKSLIHAFDIPSLNHQMMIKDGVLKEEASLLLKTYFKNKRKSK